MAAPRGGSAARANLDFPPSRRLSTGQSVAASRCAESENDERVRPADLARSRCIDERHRSSVALVAGMLEVFSRREGMIERAVGRRLLEGEAAHAMHHCGNMRLGGRRKRRVDASHTAEDEAIGVVLFKIRLSTGRDSPRAEVMMSSRRPEDHTSIAQLGGRMVRTPLARSNARDTALNDVHLSLPDFDETEFKPVVGVLKNVEQASRAETGSARELMTLGRLVDAADICEAIDKLETYRVNQARA